MNNIKNIRTVNITLKKMYFNFCIKCEKLHHGVVEII